MLDVRRELRLVNRSAATSLEEGLEEALTLHRLGVFGLLGLSLKTTNCLESLNAQLGHLTDKVDRWRTSDQKHGFQVERQKMPMSAGTTHSPRGRPLRNFN